MPRKRSPDVTDMLIYDVGMHEGEDTAFYLEKGFDVVAFEANPALVAASRKLFAAPIDAGRLRIVEGAIVPDPGVGHVVFYGYEERTKWGTIESGVIGLNPKRAEGVIETRVPTVDFAAVIGETGMPYYMKIDIEGADIHCLEALRSFEAKPVYLSIEAIEQNIERQREQIELLCELGYDRFKAVQQARMHKRTLPAHSREGRTLEYRFVKGSSGPFGSDLSGPWRTRDEIISDYDAIFSRNARFTGSVFWQYPVTRKTIRRFMEWSANVTIPGWYDTHARHSSHSGEGGV